MLEKTTLAALFICLSFFLTEWAIAQTWSEIGSSWQSWVQKEAEMQASQNRMAHIQRCPAGFRAGVGYSTASPTDAVRRCCYWRGNYPVRFFHVSRGANGWYAAALYKVR